MNFQFSPGQNYTKMIIVIVYAQRDKFQHVHLIHLSFICRVNIVEQSVAVRFSIANSVFSLLYLCRSLYMG